jgi:hypothetical protein
MESAVGLGVLLGREAGRRYERADHAWRMWRASLRLVLFR